MRERRKENKLAVSRAIMLRDALTAAGLEFLYDQRYSVMRMGQPFVRPTNDGLEHELVIPFAGSQIRPRP